MTTLSGEKELLRKLAANDKVAAETIYRDNYGLIQALIINNNGTIEDARDIFQETMLVLYEKAKQGNLELNCQLKTFIYAISRRLWLKKLQQSDKYSGGMRDIGETADADIEEDLETHADKEHSFRIMENSLSELGEPCKSLLEAYYMKKQNMSEIAARFGYTSADNAKNQKYKCLIRLKKLFFAQYKKQ